MSNSIRDLEVAIRDIVNTPRQHANRRKNAALFGKMCASLNAIGDTNLALRTYAADVAQLDSSTEDHHLLAGRKYLLTYGVLQVLFVQQDAIQHLAESFALTPESPQTQEQEEWATQLATIRSIRNDSVGHPTKRGSGEGRAFNHISRMSMRGAKFTLLTTQPDAAPKTTKVNVLEMIAIQESVFQQKLTSILDELKRQENQDRRRFRDQKLGSFFPPSLSHTLEKIGESIKGDLPNDFGANLTKSLQAALQGFREAMVARGAWNAYEDVVGDFVLDVEHALHSLENHFAGFNGLKPYTQDASVSLSFLSNRLRDLRKVALELDEDYATDV